MSAAIRQRDKYNTFNLIIAADYKNFEKKQGSFI